MRESQAKLGVLAQSPGFFSASLPYSMKGFSLDCMKSTQEVPLVASFRDCDQIPNRNNLSDGELCLGLVYYGRIPRDECGCSPHFLNLYAVEDPSPWDHAAHIQGRVFPPLLNTCECALKCTPAGLLPAWF